jgi:uncharacterized protein
MLNSDHPTTVALKRALALHRHMCYRHCMLNRDLALATLRSSESVLRSMGVEHAGIFGSVARGTNSANSDLDVMLDLNPAAHLTVFDYAGIKTYIAGLFDVPVDVVVRANLKPYVGVTAVGDAVYAF